MRQAQSCVVDAAAQVEAFGCVGDGRWHLLAYAVTQMLGVTRYGGVCQSNGDDDDAGRFRQGGNPFHRASESWHTAGEYRAEVNHNVGAAQCGIGAILESDRRSAQTACAFVGVSFAGAILAAVNDQYGSHRILLDVGLPPLYGTAHDARREWANYVGGDGLDDTRDHSVENFLFRLETKSRQNDVFP